MPLTANAATGTLPLLAALAIGIAVAVGAVVAFLKVTAKGRDLRGHSDWSDAEEDGVDAGAGPDFREYTIPLTTVPLAGSRPETPERAEPRVCGIGGEFSGTDFPVGGAGLSIGRDPSACQIVFPMGAGEVSRRHCTLLYEEGNRIFLLEDHGSSNGTFLPDGRRLEPGKRYELRPGEWFSLSGTVHRFEVRE